jgi:alkanesulfonate monooxygenase SsuD/methylene tetrahydromethanopterin reductase-like flavin-dependent oxidoreductase (luciferase family)
MEIGAFLSYGMFKQDEEAQQATLYDRMLELAVTAEEAGASYIWAPEHHMIYMNQSPSALIPAVQIAQHVKCRVGTAVIVLPYHQAIQLAGEIAQADCATGGRLELGVARGAYGYEFDKFKIPFDTSRDHFIEMLEGIKELFRDETKEASFHGKFVNFDDIYVWPRPIQKAHPPIWIAAQAPAAVEDAARRGYNVLNSLFLWDDEHLENIVEHFKRGRDAGERKDVKLGITRYAYVGKDEQDVEERIDELFEHWRIHIQLHDFSHRKNPRGIIIPAKQDVEPSREDVRRNLLIGTADHVAKKLAYYESLGVSVVNLNINYAPAHDKVMGSLERLGPLLGSYRQPNQVPEESLA